MFGKFHEMIRRELAPGCSMKDLPRDVAFWKIWAMTEAVSRLHAGFGG